MEKFIECLESNSWMMACQELENMSNSFGFARKVPEVVERMARRVPKQGEDFCVAFVLAMSKRHADGRCERSVELAQDLAKRDLAFENFCAEREVEMQVVGHSMHPTVMQQAAQLAFYYLDTRGLVPSSLKGDKSWWMMPLI